MGIINYGTFIVSALAALGLSAILATSTLVFNSIKLLGATYLIYLGITTFLRKEALTTERAELTVNDWQIYKQGLLTNLLNPKVALFFLSLLPQYVDTQSQAGSLPFFILGITFVCTSTIWSLGIAYGSSFFVGLFKKNERTKKMTNKIAGCIYIGLGLNLLRATAKTS
ncbi:LysE family translocator [Enterococcus ureilyticus]|uniref:LysE family translocator n=1 Tax=Enterococcus ureilyticus TaxID=1131292 RepID=UPI001A91DF51|nr:LysE family translocator [Enterococcus ureilyticus]MBO0444931.1 LysE family translocator [Enterococcus ureilyticus]